MLFGPSGSGKSYNAELLLNNLNDKIKPWTKRCTVLLRTKTIASCSAHPRCTR